MRRSSSPEWTTSRSTTILAGVMHALDMRSSRVAVIYNDPHRPYYQCLAARREGGPAALGPAAESNLIAVLQDLHSASDAEATSKIEHFEREAALAFGRIADPPKLDSRIQSAIDLVMADLTRNRPLDELAEAIGLSSSRLQHLFTEQVGVPLRRFRMWIRFRGALERFTNGTSFTTAAIESGFSDSATFSHAFRATFGVSASSVLKAGRMPRVVTV